jgi:hypothetical protein
MKIKSLLLVLMFALTPAMWTQDKPRTSPSRPRRWKPNAGRASPNNDGDA